MDNNTHFNQFQEDKDRIVHLLINTLSVDTKLYNQAIEECTYKYGQVTVEEALVMLNTDYKSIVEWANKIREENNK